jgi:hypothetical protein
MKRIALAALAGIVVFAAQAAAPGLPKPSPHVIETLTVLQRDCLSLHLEGARVLMARADLKVRAARRGQPYQNEEERLAWRAGRRAGALLDAATATRDASGCSVIDRGRLDQDALFLVSQLLELGKIMVMRDGKTAPESRVMVHDFGQGAATYRGYQFPDGGDFFTLMLWIS